MPPASDYDSAWKDALEGYFPAFMALLWPDLCARISWQHPPVFRDKELQSLMRSARRGRRHVDKLVSVRLRNGQESLLLIHVEIQGGREQEFPQRMYHYYIRLYEKYPDEPIVSLAVLSSAPLPGPRRREAHPPGKTFRLSHLAEFWHCRLRFTFPVVYLESWRSRMDELMRLAPGNPLAVVILAQLEANASRADAQRLLRKTELVRCLYHWGYQRDNVIRLFRIIDAMLALPEALERAFEEAIVQLEEETHMNYVTSIERVRLRREREEGKVEGKAEGKTEGYAMLLSSQISRKFGTLPDWAKVRLVAADELALSRWAEQILDAQCIEDVFKS